METTIRYFFLSEEEALLRGLRFCRKLEEQFLEMMALCLFETVSPSSGGHLVIRAESPRVDDLLQIRPLFWADENVCIDPRYLIRIKAIRDMVTADGSVCSSGRCGKWDIQYVGDLASLSERELVTQCPPGQNIVRYEGLTVRHCKVALAEIGLSFQEHIHSRSSYLDWRPDGVNLAELSKRYFAETDCAISLAYAWAKYRLEYDYEAYLQEAKINPKFFYPLYQGWRRTDYLGDLVLAAMVDKGSVPERWLCRKLDEAKSLVGDFALMPLPGWRPENIALLSEKYYPAKKK